MIFRKVLKHYSEVRIMSRKMKDSGIEWVGDIPESWNVIRNKNCFRCDKTIVGEASSETQLLSLTKYGVKEKNAEDSTGKVPESYDTYQVVEKDDIVMCLFDLDCSAVFSGISPFNGMISPAYKILKCNSVVDPYYIDYWFSYVFDGRKFMHYSKNLRYTLNYDEFAVLPIVVPSIAEQKKISDFLYAKCVKIDNIITKTQASIDEYKKLKQSIITQAVTQGVRGDREMKDSGNVWVGKIPLSWKKSRIGLHYDIILGKMLCSQKLKNDYSYEPYYCAANVHFSGIDNENLKSMWFSEEEKHQYKVKVGDLLVVEGGAGAGGCSVVNELNQNIYIQNSIMIVRSKGNCSVKYLKYFIESLVNQGYIDFVCNKATIPHFTKDKLGNMPIVLSEEMNEIAEYLDDKCNEIDLLIEKKEKMIEQIELYKKSLIYEYVTGKKEVV